ncbi:MAG: translation initiation factor 2 [Lachnospiraceae bacterium]|nr:translation initiation factor 2 [Lachnospiraceae bacterium]
MVGRYEIDVYNNRVHFHLEVKRNITVIQGDSATGKTQLIRLLSDYNNSGVSSGVTVVSEAPCAVLTTSAWKQKALPGPGSIVFVDEDFAPMYSEEFARYIKGADDYFVLICRDSLFELPYSIEEIYGMRQGRPSQKYSSAKRVYNELFALFNVKCGSTFRPDCVITEDSNAGHVFLSCVYESECVSAGGKSSVADCISREAQSGKKTLAIVDGAAYGADMEKTMRLMDYYKDRSALYAPESFEYLLLSAGIVEVQEELIKETWNYADSSEFFSWEDFYTKTLSTASAGTVFQYNKGHLNEAYKTKGCIESVKRILPEEIRP